MRLLLLLSALFTALAGVAGTRAQAQPVQASAAVLAPLAAAAMPSRVASRFVDQTGGRLPLASPALPRLMDAATRRLLYAERRRE